MIIHLYYPEALRRETRTKQHKYPLMVKNFNVNGESLTEDEKGILDSVCQRWGIAEGTLFDATWIEASGYKVLLSSDKLIETQKELIELIRSKIDDMDKEFREKIERTTC